jgi:hypothetical protein
MTSIGRYNKNEKLHKKRVFDRRTKMMKALLSGILILLALLWAKIKWGLKADVWEDGKMKMVAAETKDGDSFYGDRPWGTGKTWRSAFRDAKN